MNFHKPMIRCHTVGKRAFLDNVGCRWYVETLPDRDGEVQGRTVTEAVTDRYGMPVCLRVSREEESGRTVKDGISVERVGFFEPYGRFVSDYTEYEDRDEMNQYLAGLGFAYNEADCLWRNLDTGEEICV